MLGFLFGTLCLIGLVKVLRWGRYGGACAGHAHHHHHGWHGGGWSRGPRWGGGGHWGAHRERGRGGWLRGLFERLDTSPGQEKVIKQAAEEIFASTRELRGELDATRRDIASAMRGPSIDEVALGELFARHDDKLREARKAMVGALANVHDALDERQREQLAELIASGLGGWGASQGGPYRGGRWS